MTKSVFCAVLIIFILGFMANEIQGQLGKLCKEPLPQTDCGAGSCGALCRQLKHGTGHCLRGSEGKYVCFCYFKCPS
ncbi:hypothetical protein BRARA_B02942 [Brassica rapa]|uniref:Knottin scorpion toxin-like domain-containing protein n=1 Tax=Brassica campestris TaxID=3711 RepID=A0A398AK24_BRACM|nr:hypothetical protein BRARA_B02942 [Brassica rapa]